MAHTLGRFEDLTNYARLDGGHLGFWQNPPQDSWGLCCGISTMSPGSVCKNSALTSKFLPQNLNAVDYKITHA